MLVLKRPKAGNITGHVRIRSNMQGITLSLSDICVLLTILLLTDTSRVAQKDNKPSF